MAQVSKSHRRFLYWVIALCALFWIAMAIKPVYPRDPGGHAFELILISLDAHQSPSMYVGGFGNHLDRFAFPSEEGGDQLAIESGNPGQHNSFGEIERPQKRRA